MMKKSIYGLLLLLLAQVGLVVIMQSGDSGLEAETADTALFDFTIEKITSVKIEDSEGQSLTLTQEGGRWGIEEASAAPADTTQLTSLLEKLSLARVGLAVSTSKGSTKRFKTTEDEFERHILIKAGQETVADFYLGTSAGFRHSHIRRADDDRVFSLPVSDFEFSTEPADWLDRSLARVDLEKVNQVEYGDVVLVREEDDWLLQAPMTGKANEEKLDDLLDALTSLTVGDIYPSAEVSRLFEGESDLRFRLELSDDTVREMILVEYEDGHVLKMSDSELFFKVESWQVEKIREFDLEELITATADKTDTAEPGRPESP